MKSLKRLFNFREHLRRFCEHCFPANQLFDELGKVIEEQQRKVINCEDAVLIAQSNARLEKNRLANFQRSHARLRGNLAA